MPPRQRTAPPGAIYEQAERFQAELDTGVRAAEDRMLAGFNVAYDRARLELQDVLDKITRARQAGEDVSPAWLYQQERLANVVRTTEQQMAAYAGHAAVTTEQAQGLSQAAGVRHAEALALQAGGPALAASFVQTNEANTRRLVGFLSDGSPLRDLMGSWAEETAAQVQDALLQGVTLGKGVDWMARQVTEALDMPRHRSVTIMRTETQRVYRAVAQETYQENAELLEGWVWHAHLGPRTCAACLAMHGTVHPVTETLDGHPRCRCSMVPRTKSWAELGLDDMEDTRPPLEDGKAWLAGQPERVQRAILGPAKLKAWRDGKISLDDVVARTHSDAWGTMRRERSLLEIQQGRNANTLPAARAPQRPAQPLELQPEPQFVDRLAQALDDGTMTVAQLQEGAAKASPLGQVNAREAIRVHLERQEKARAARGGKPLDFSSAQEARDWANRHWSGPDGYTAEELAALRDYTGSAYGPMNNTLRSSKGKRTNAKIRAMDAAMEKAARVPDDIQVVRNANLRQLGITGTRQDPRTAVGRELVDHGYLSTSINRRGAMQGEVRLSINVPKGSRGIYVSGDGGPKSAKIISDYGGGESELILDRGSRLVIRSVRKVGKRWHVDADLIQDVR